MLPNRTMKQVKPTFKSFISANGNTGHEGDRKSSCSTYTIEESRFYGYSIDIHSANINLLPGEISISRVEEVCQSPIYEPDKEDSVGTIFVTNYRVVFVPKNQSSCENKFESARRNKLIGLEDIAMSNILNVYQVSKGKKRKLLPKSYVSGFVKRLQLHCKDFRVHQFSFKNCLRDHVKILVNAILNHFCPTNVELLFAFSYADNILNAGSQSAVSAFLSVEEWHSELKRLGNPAFTVTDCNRGFKLADSLPECFVVPMSLTDSQIQKFQLDSNNKCFPVWCYSHGNGCALIRMASGRSDTSEEMAAFVSRSHPKLMPPEVIDLDNTSLLPPLKKLQTNFEQMRDLCMPSTYKELANADSYWFSLLESSQWMSVVSCSLNVTRDVVYKIISMNRSVIIKEKDGTDYNALISALVQVCLDSFRRTICGFQSLIEKEWVALGHRFAHRCSFVYAKDAEPSPVFLLFLDCVWQLLRQFPSSFEFTEIFLISVWDSVSLGMFRNFIFNSPREQCSVAASRQQNSLPMSVWDWNRQFAPEDIDFFVNPLSVASEQICNLQLANKGNTKLGIYSNTKSQVLLPRCLVCGLEFWENCYLRWLVPFQIIGGGKPSEYIAQSQVMEEIASLQFAISELERTSASKSTNILRQNKVFPFVFGNSSSILRREVSKHVSSSYPFSPTKVVSHAVLLPLPSPNDRASYNDDTLSIDELSEVTEL